MGGKNQTQTNTSSQSYTPAGMSGLQDIWSRLQSVASQPYQPYTGQLTAGLTNTQQSGINNVNSAYGTAQPYIDQATNYANQAAGPINSGQIQNYLNPYNQSVIDATQAQFANQNAQQANALKGNSIARGAFGGNREAVGQAALAGQQQLAQAPVIAQLNAQNYSQALNAAQQDRAAQGQSAYALGNLGMTAQHAALQGAQAQLGAGTLEQQSNQNALNAQYQQYLQAQAFPYQQAQFLASLGVPTLGAQGGSTTGSQTQTAPGPSPWGQALGFGTAALGLFSDERVKENSEKVGKTFDGQNIYKFNYKGDPTTHIGLMAQEVEKKKPEAVGEVGGVKTVNYDVATKDSRYADGGSVSPFSMTDVVGYVPKPMQIAAANPGSGSLPSMSGGSAGSRDSGLPSVDTMKGFMGGLKGLAGNLFPAEGGNYAANMAGPAMVGNTGTGMVIGGLKNGGSVDFMDTVHQIRGGLKKARYADGGSVNPFDARFATGGFIPNYIEGSDRPMSIPLVDPDKPMRPTYVGSQEMEPDRSEVTTNAIGSVPFASRWNDGSVAAPSGAATINSVPADVSLAKSDWNAPVEQPIPTPRPTPLSGLNQTPANAVITKTTPTAGYSDNMGRYGNAISGIESGGKYDALGPVIQKTGDRAYGKYQIMGANIPQWTKEVLGTSMTPQQFLANPQAQDAVFRGKFGQYVNKYGPEGAAKAWFAGEGGMNNPNAKDPLGTTVAGYAGKFLNNLGLPTGGRPIQVADDGQIPANATLTQAKPQSQYGGWNPFNLSDDARSGLVAAGLGMMASRSPFALTQIGEGGLQGLKNYQDLKSAGSERAMKQQQIDLQAQNMARQADQFSKEFGLKQKQVGLEQKKLDQPVSVPYGSALVSRDTGKPVFENRNLSVNNDTLTKMADQYLSGDKSVFQNLGRGAQGAETIMALRQRISERMDELGVTPEQQAIKMAEYTGMTAGQRTLGTRTANIEMAANEARNMMKPALDLSDKMDRTNWVPINRAIQAYQGGTSDPTLAAWGAANFSLVNTYVRAIAPTGVPPESAREHALKMLNTAMGPDAYRAVVNQMNVEMEAALKSPEQVKDKFRDLYGTIGNKKPSETHNGQAGGQSFTGRTATNSKGEKLRETTDGKWVP